MKVKLTNEDRCAIDLVLEHRAASGAGGNLEHCYDKSAGAKSLKRRVDAVEKLCDVLDASPAAEPAPNLVAKTMRFIEENAHATVAAGVHAPAAQARPRTLIHHHAEHRSLH